MLHQLIRYALEEIAYSGPPGSKFSDIVMNLNNRKAEGADCPQLLEALRHHLLHPEELQLPCFIAEGSGEEEDPVVDVLEDYRNNLLGIALHPDICEHVVHKSIIYLVSNARYQGLWGYQLCPLLNIDHKQLHHLTSKLIQEKIIVRFNLMIPKVIRRQHKGSVSPISCVLFLAQFYDLQRMDPLLASSILSEHIEPISDRVVQLLRDSPHQLLLEVDVRNVVHSMFKGNLKRGQTQFRRCRDKLEREKKIEVVKVWSAELKVYRKAICIYGTHVDTNDISLTPQFADMGAQEEDDGLLSSTPRRESAPTSIRGLESPKTTRSEGDEEYASSEGMKTPKKNRWVGVGTFFRGHVSPDIIADLVRASGSKGFTNAEISKQLPVDKKFTERALDWTLKEYPEIRKDKDTRGKVSFWVYRFGQPEDEKPRAMLEDQFVPIIGDEDEMPAVLNLEGLSALGRERAARTLRLVREHGVLSVVDLGRAIDAEEGRGTKIDRKTLTKIADKVVEYEPMLKKTSTMYRSQDVSVVYWGSACTEEEAQQRVTAALQLKHSELTSSSAIKKRKRDSLASELKSEADEDAVTSAAAALLGGEFSSPEIPTENALATQALFPIVASSVDVAHAGPRRRTVNDLNAAAVYRPPTIGKTASRCGGTFSQNVCVHYGYVGAIMLRCKYLHQFLLKNMRAAWFNAEELTMSLDVQLFLQIVGCGIPHPYLDEYLVSGSRSNLKVGDLPQDVKDHLTNPFTLSDARNRRAKSFAQIKQLLSLLVRLNLVRVGKASEVDQSHHPGGDSVLYYAHDKVTLKPFLPASDAPDSLLQEISESEHDPDGEEYIFFDPEELPPSSPGADNRDIMDACEDFWNTLQRNSLRWRRKVMNAVEKVNEQQEGEKKPKTKHSSEVFSKGRGQLPAGCDVSELFFRKNWTGTLYVSATQRNALEQLLKQLSEEPVDESYLVNGVRVVDASNPLVKATCLEHNIDLHVALKYLRRRVLLSGEKGDKFKQTVDFVPVHAVRYKCHICHFLTSHRVAILSHYRARHGYEQLPDDPTLYTAKHFIQTVLNSAGATSRHNYKELISSQALTDQPRPHKRRRRNRSQAMQQLDEVQAEDAPVEGSGGTPDPHLSSFEIALFKFYLATAKKLVDYREPAIITSEVPEPNHRIWSIVAAIVGKTPQEAYRLALRSARGRTTNKSGMSHGVYNYLPLGYESSTAPINVVPSYLNATKDLLGDSILSALTRMILLTPNSSYSSHATRHSLFRMGYKEEDIRMSFQLWHARGMVGRARRADFAGRKFMLSNIARMAVYGKAADISLLRDGLACLEGDADSAGVVHAEPSGSWMQVLANCVAQGRVTLDCIWFPEATTKAPPAAAGSDVSIPNVQEEEEEEHQSDAEDDELMEDNDDNEEGGGQQIFVGIRKHLELTQRPGGPDGNISKPPQVMEAVSWEINEDEEDIASDESQHGASASEFHRVIMEVAQNASEFNPAGYGVVAKGDVVTVTPEAAEEQAAKEHYKEKEYEKSAEWSPAWTGFMKEEYPKLDAKRTLEAASWLLHRVDVDVARTTPLGMESSEADLMQKYKKAMKQKRRRWPDFSTVVVILEKLRLTTRIASNTTDSTGWMILSAEHAMKSSFGRYGRPEEYHSDAPSEVSLLAEMISKACPLFKRIWMPEKAPTGIVQAACRVLESAHLDITKSAKTGFPTKFLPDDFVPLAAWVCAGSSTGPGSVNFGAIAQLLQTVMLNLQQSPGLTSSIIQDHIAVIPLCEVQVILEMLTQGGAVYTASEELAPPIGACCEARLFSTEDEESNIDDPVYYLTLPTYS